MLKYETWPTDKLIPYARKQAVHAETGRAYGE